MAVTVRYIVHDTAAARDFYAALGFEADMEVPGFAMLRRGDLRLLLNQPGAGGAGQPSDAGDAPAPGGWNRIQVEVDDVTATAERLVATGGTIRTSPVQGNGGVQAVVDDPSGNAVELLTPPAG